MSTFEDPSAPPRLPVVHYCADLAVVLVLSIGLEILVRVIGPHESGFFCDDHSIRLPYYAHETVALEGLIAYCILLNLVLILAVESFLTIKYPLKAYTYYERRRPALQRVLIKFAIFYGYFVAFDLLINVITTYSKYPVGRLRPHFIEVCKPIVHLTSGDRVLTTNCKGLENLFITNYTCSGPSKGAIIDSRLSFFSGHASLAMGASTFAILYLQERLCGKIGCRLVVPALQLIIAGFGLCISYSRVSDYRHHRTDVAIGIFVGMSLMALLCRFVAGFFKPKPPPEDDETLELSEVLSLPTSGRRTPVH